MAEAAVLQRFIAIPERPLPEGSRLLHIGPPKTGTTSVQAAFDRRRAEVLEQGVRYAGSKRHSRQAVLAATDARGVAAAELEAGRREWAAIVREIRQAEEPRVLLSSERLAHAEPQHIRAIVEALDPGRVHVVVTLRSLARILPAQWQQGVQSGLEAPFDDWLRGILAEQPDDPRSFWHRHAHDRLVARWRDIVGADRMTVVVLDEGDRGSLLRTFEALLDLRDGTLELHRDLSNRSLNRPEAEAIRALNASFNAELPAALHRPLVELGASFRMRLAEPDPDEHPIRLPAWAVTPVARISEAIVESLGTAGVEVIGDLERLRVAGDALAPGTAPVPAAAEDHCITPRVAAAMAMGVLAASGAAPRGFAIAAAEPGATTVDTTLDRLPVRRLAGVVARRLGRAGMGRLRAARTRIA